MEGKEEEGCGGGVGEGGRGGVEGEEYQQHGLINRIMIFRSM